MNNKSKLLALSAFVFSAIAIVGCNQEKTTFTVSFTGENCVAKKEGDAKAESSFEFTANKGEKVALDVNANDGYILRDKNSVVYTVNSVELFDFDLTSAVGGDAKKLTFTVSGDTTIKVTAVNLSDLKINTVSKGLYVGLPAGPHVHDTDVEVTLTPSEGYRVPDDVTEEYKELITIKDTLGNNYDVKNYEVDEDGIATFSFKLGTYDVTIDATAIGKTYSLKDESYGCKLELPDESLCIVGDEIKVYMRAKDGFELPQSTKYITIKSEDDAFDTFNASRIGTDVEGTYFVFVMPAGNAILSAKCISYPVNIEFVDVVGAELTFVKPGPIGRGEEVLISAQKFPGYTLDEDPTVDLYYYDGGEKKSIEYTFDTTDKLLKFVTPMVGGERLNIYLSFTAAYEIYEIDTAEWEAKEGMKSVTISATEPKYHVDDTIVVDFVTNDGWKVPFSVDDFYFEGINPEDVVYTREDGGTVGKLTFTMPANNVKICGDPVKLEYDINVTVKDALGKVRGSGDISGEPEFGETITVTLEADLGYKFSTDKTQGYEFEGITADDVTLTTLEHRLDLVQLSFSMPANDVAIHAVVDQITYKAEAHIDHATCSAYSKDATVGADVEFVFTPDDGYSMPSKAQLSFSGITSDKVTYTVDEDTGAATIKFKMPANDVSITGFAINNEYKVTFDYTDSHVASVVISGTTDKHHYHEKVVIELEASDKYYFEDDETVTPHSVVTVLDDEGAPVAHEDLLVRDDNKFATLVIPEMPDSDITVKVTAVPDESAIIKVITNNCNYEYSGEPDAEGIHTITFTTAAVGTDPATPGYAVPKTVGELNISGDPEYVSYTYNNEDSSVLKVKLGSTGSTIYCTALERTYADGVNALTHIKGEQLTPSTYNHKVVWSLVADLGYVLPDAAPTVTYTDGSVTPEYNKIDNTTATLTYTQPAGVVTVTAAATQYEYRVFSSITNGTISGITGTVHAGATVNVVITANEGYKAATQGDIMVYGVPDTIAWVIDATAGTSTGSFTMPANDVSIHATCQKIHSDVSVTLTDGAYHISGNGDYGDTMIVSVAANEGYKLPETFTVTGTTSYAYSRASDTSGTISFTMPKNAVTISGACTKAPQARIIQIADGITGGIITADRSVALPGETVLGHVYPGSGKVCTEVTATAGIIHYTPGSDIFSLDVPTEESQDAITISATFIDAPKTRAITIGTITGGTITVDKSLAKPGETVFGHVIPDSGKVCKEVTATAGNINYTPGSDIFSLEVPTTESEDPITISATFDDAPKARTITTDGAVGGTVSINKFSALPGETVIGQVDPSTGYKCTAVNVSDPSAELHYTAGDSTFWFKVPEGEGAITVTATFANQTFVIRPNVTNENAPASVSVAYGQNATVVFNGASAGYHIARDQAEFIATHSVTGTYASLSYSYADGAGTLVINNVTSEITLIGSAPKDDPVATPINVNQSAGGTLSVDKNEAFADETVGGSVTADPGKQCTGVFVNGVSTDVKYVAGESKFYFTMPTTDAAVTVTATFADAPSTDTYSLGTRGDSGIVSLSKQQSITAGETITFTSTEPLASYHVEDEEGNTVIAQEDITYESLAGSFVIPASGTPGFPAAPAILYFYCFAE